MNIAGMMKQAKQMQEKMATLQEEIAKITVEGTSGGGMVKVVMSCKGAMETVEIDPSVISADDKEMLEDLVKAAVNDARAKADEKTAAETQKLMGDMGLPPGMDLPF